MKADLAMRQRLEARANQPRAKEVASPAFSATVRQADAIGAIKARITARTAAGSTTYAAVGNLGALIDAAYNAGALGVTAMVLA
jgi:hypothetical protein